MLCFLKDVPPCPDKMPPMRYSSQPISFEKEIERLKKEKFERENDPDKNYIKDWAYVSAMAKKNDLIWKREQNLYYSYKNSNYLIPELLLMAFFIFTKGGIFSCLIIFFAVEVMKYHNNEQLDKDPWIIEKRREYRRIRRREGDIF